MLPPCFRHGAVLPKMKTLQELPKAANRGESG